MDGVFDAVAVRVVLEARKWQGESAESHTARSEDLCYQVQQWCSSGRSTIVPVKSRATT